MEGIIQQCAKIVSIKNGTYTTVQSTALSSLYSILFLHIFFLPHTISFVLLFLALLSSLFLILPSLSLSGIISMTVG